MPREQYVYCTVKGTVPREQYTVGTLRSGEKEDLSLKMNHFSVFTLFKNQLLNCCGLFTLKAIFVEK